MFDSDYCLGSGMSTVSEAQIRHGSVSNWSTQSSRTNMFYDIFDTEGVVCTAATTELYPQDLGGHSL